MARAPKPSAGLFMYRRAPRGVEILLVHPGGPFWAKKDIGSWDFPKGQADNGEEGQEQMLEVAKREFKEETSFDPVGEFTYVGSVKKPNGMGVHAWMFEGDCDPTKLESNKLTIEWPPRSGKKIEILEIDKGAFYTFEEAKEKIYQYQLPLLEMVQKAIEAK